MKSKAKLSLTEAVSVMRDYGLGMTPAALADGIQDGIYPFGRVVSISANGRRSFEVFRVDLVHWLRMRLPDDTAPIRQKPPVRVKKKKTRQASKKPTAEKKRRLQRRRSRHQKQRARKLTTAKLYQAGGDLSRRNISARAVQAAEVGYGQYIANKRV